MEQDTVDTYKKIYKENRVKEIIPFLKGLSIKERKSLVPELKKRSDYRQQDKNNDIYFAACVACCTKTQYKALTEYVWKPMPELMDQVLEWYCPDWFSDYYNEKGEDYFYPLDYKSLLRWQAKGYLQPSDTLIARSLVRAGQVEKGKMPFSKSFEEEYPIIFDTHIWSVFRANTYVNYLYNHNDRSEGPWVDLFKTYTANGRIDRMRVLRECLLTVDRGLARDVLSWFADLFAVLKPSEEELLALQNELFGSLHSPISKVVNKALIHIKCIADKPGFHFADFVAYLPMLLTSEVKMTVNSTLAILEKRAKRNKTDLEPICRELTLVFLNKDESLQTKAAKLILSYGDVGSEELKDRLAGYQSHILMSVQSQLKDYLPDEESAEEFTSPPTEGVEPLDLLSDENRVQTIKTVEDLIFFLSQAFDYNDPINLDLLPEALIRLNKEITSDRLNQLEIGLRKAYETSCGDSLWYNYNHQTNEYVGTNFWGEGLYVRLLAMFFINYCQYLAGKYPEESKFINEMHQQYIEEAKKATYKYFPFKNKIAPLKDWYGNNLPLLRPYIQILTKALESIENTIERTLLSTPTHYPAWVSPRVLTKRLAVYRSLQMEVDEMDLQLALSRIPPGYEQELGSLQVKYADTINGLKAHLTHYTWEVSKEKKQDLTYTDRFYLSINIPASPWREENNIYAGIGDAIRRCISPRDIMHLVLTYPSVPGIPYGLLIKDRFEFSQTGVAENRDILTDGIATLFRIKTELDPIATLFLACCMLCSEKNIRNYSAEIWLERTPRQLLDNRLLGETLGKLIASEWAPAKRITDLMDAYMLGISPSYNQYLETFVVYILKQINSPVTNLKKLLEIYNELLALNQSACHPDLVARLSGWQNENTLKKIVKLIVERA